jgi:hypothetical protein
MNYLPVQGSSVPCKHVFSLSAETDTKKHNQIKPVLMEALQMLKFYCKKSLLNFTTGLVLEEGNFEEGDSKDLLVKLLSSHPDCTQHSIDKILTSLSDPRDKALEDNPNEVAKVDSESDFEDGKDSEDNEEGEEGEEGEDDEDSVHSTDGKDGTTP